MTDAHLLELQHIRELLAKILARFPQAQEDIRPLRLADRAELEQLLPAIWAGFGPSTWSTSDLWHAPLPEGRDALAAQLGPQSAQRALAIGRLLERGNARNVGGLVVMRHKKVSTGRLWSLMTTNANG